METCPFLTMAHARDCMDEWDIVFFLIWQKKHWLKNHSSTTKARSNNWSAKRIQRNEWISESYPYFEHVWTIKTNQNVIQCRHREARCGNTNPADPSSEFGYETVGNCAPFQRIRLIRTFWLSLLRLNVWVSTAIFKQYLFKSCSCEEFVFLEQTERQRDAGIAGVKPVSLAVKGMHVRLGFAAPEED